MFVYIIVGTCVFAVFVSLLIGLRADIVGKRLGIVDWPDQSGGRKRHLRPTPLVGGLACCSAAIVAALATTAFGGSDSSDLRWFSLAVFLMYLIGVADDRHSLSPQTRLALSVGVLLMALSYAPSFSLSALRFSVGSVLVLGPIGLLFTLVCIVGLINSVNMADGKDGLVITLCLIWSLVLGVQASAMWIPVIAATACALLVMLWFNLKGALFLGDGGSYGLSTIFGLMAIHIHIADPVNFGADHVALLFAVPVLDTIRLISIRIVRGVSPFAGDRDHLHHHLARRWGWPKGLYVYAGLVGLPNVLAYLFPTWAVFILVGVTLAYTMVIMMSHRPDEDVLAPETINNVSPIRRSPIAIVRAPTKAYPADEDAA